MLVLKCSAQRRVVIQGDNLTNYCPFLSVCANLRLAWETSLAAMLRRPFYDTENHWAVRSNDGKELHTTEKMIFIIRRKGKSYRKKWQRPGLLYWEERQAWPVQCGWLNRELILGSVAIRFKIKHQVLNSFSFPAVEHFWWAVVTFICFSFSVCGYYRLFLTENFCFKYFPLPHYNSNLAPPLMFNYFIFNSKNDPQSSA